MPITKERAMGIINAAIDCQNAMRDLISIIQHEYSLAKDHGNYAAAFENTLLHANEYQLLSNPVESPRIIANEREYFAKKWRHNESERLRLARLRGTPLKRRQDRGPNPTVELLTIRPYNAPAGLRDINAPTYYRASPEGRPDPHNPSLQAKIKQLEELEHQEREALESSKIPFMEGDEPKGDVFDEGTQFHSSDGKEITPPAKTNPEDLI